MIQVQDIQNELDNLIVCLEKNLKTYYELTKDVDGFGNLNLSIIKTKAEIRILKKFQDQVEKMYCDSLDKMVEDMKAEEIKAGIKKLTGDNPPYCKECNGEGTVPARAQDLQCDFYHCKECDGTGYNDVAPESQEPMSDFAKTLVSICKPEIK